MSPINISQCVYSSTMFSWYVSVFKFTKRSTSNLYEQTSNFITLYTCIHVSFLLFVEIQLPPPPIGPNHAPICTSKTSHENNFSLIYNKYNKYSTLYFHRAIRLAEFDLPGPTSFKFSILFLISNFLAFTRTLSYISLVNTNINLRLTL